MDTLLSNLSLGLSTTAVGLLVVFFGLVILIGFIYALVFLVDHIKMPSKPKEVVIPKAPAPPPPRHEETAIRPEVVAAISAAIAMMTESEGKSFVVRRIKRI